MGSILPTVNTECGLKGFTQYVGVNIQSGVSPSDKINILERPKTVFFFPKAGVISQRRETAFLFLTEKLIKMTLSPHQSVVSAVRLASKYPSPTP